MDRSDSLCACFGADICEPCRRRFIEHRRDKAAPPPPAEQASGEFDSWWAALGVNAATSVTPYVIARRAWDAALSQRPVVDYNGPYGVRCAWDRITSNQGLPCDYEVVGKALSALAPQQPEQARPDGGAVDLADALLQIEGAKFTQTGRPPEDVREVLRHAAAALARPAPAPDVARLVEAAELMREAAAVLLAVSESSDTDHLPACWRWPLLDELEGSASIITAAQQEADRG